ncbi:MAG: Rieske (2Fe-2S) protein [Acidobacteria bacterium]|nr:Rieske (2Fe-2S) protein [Acidobacteriota bacterium]MCW5970410.1 Rieske (2Fe-2S) protein [Blastocatellales bacterium]
MREQMTIPPDGKPMSDQPRWRRDFPIDWPEDQYVARRDFTKFLVLTSLAFVAGQFWIAWQNFLRRRQGRLPVSAIMPVIDLPVGGARAFSYPGQHDPCLLVRTAEDRFVAFDQRCTHLACAVVPEVDKGRFFCPCHNGSFDLETGRPLQGPPRRPLPRVTLEIRNGVIYATGVEPGTV